MTLVYENKASGSKKLHNAYIYTEEPTHKYSCSVNVWIPSATWYSNPTGGVRYGNESVFFLFSNTNERSFYVHACLKGYDSTCGLVTKLDDPAIKDSVVVSVLKKQGAIPFIKTNIPQGLFR